ncbi:glycerol-3-phosphate 1-O-acyltransferase PlsY [Silvibacterium acidisoli]|uniref:glycerol-3-phosphate 1-O-acyltransferase PlsY n=1 Tax=Acidobacteriaceae bacterium ZG23-2 TaxID=2883246 RepID=UPI00406C2CD2
MPLSTYFFVAVGAYLLGSIPFGFLLVRAVLKEDIRSKGSGNIGATNVLRSGNKGLGALTFLLDACKGFLAVWLTQFVPAGQGVSRQNLLAIAALFAILGHIYTVWLRFKGGKGVATAFGVFVAIAPLAALASLGVFAVVFLLSKYVSLASILAAIAFPCFAMVLRHPAYGSWLTAVIFLAAVIVIAKHHQNIGRLVRGTEYRFGKKSGAATA